MSGWEQPEVGPDDRLIEAAIVLADGTEEPIVVIFTPAARGWSVAGYSRSIDLPPGASLDVVVPDPDDYDDDSMNWFRRDR